MDEGKSNVKIIRATVLINSFATQYFEVVIIVYLLSKGVTPWVAVSIPLVIELFNNISRIMDKFLKIAITVDYKKYHLFFIVSCAIIYILISMCRDVYSIYLFCALLGVINGINYSCITRINTSNSKYEAACFFEEERSYTIGATLGLIVSQIMYDCNPLIYVIGFIVVAIIGIILNKKITNIKIKDDMKPIEHVDTIPKKEKRQLLIITTLYGIMVGIWCIGLSGLDQIVPLITSKTGYLNSIYTGVELIALFIISGALLEKIKTKNKLLFWEMIIALMDILYLLIATIFQNMYALIGIFFLYNRKVHIFF